MANYSQMSLDEIADALDDCLDYEEVADVAKARRVVTLARIFKRRRPSEAARGDGRSFRFSDNSLDGFITDARAYVAAVERASSTTSSVTDADLSGFRGG